MVRWWFYFMPANFSSVSTAYLKIPKKNCVNGLPFDHKESYRFISRPSALFLRQELDQVLFRWLTWVGIRTNSIYYAGPDRPVHLNFKLSGIKRFSLTSFQLTTFLPFWDLSDFAALNFIFGSDPLYCQTT